MKIGKIKKLGFACVFFALTAVVASGCKNMENETRADEAKICENVKNAGISKVFLNGDKDIPLFVHESEAVAKSNPNILDFPYIFDQNVFLQWKMDNFSFENAYLKYYSFELSHKVVNDVKNLTKENKMEILVEKSGSPVFVSPEFLAKFNEMSSDGQKEVKNVVEIQVFYNGIYVSCESGRFWFSFQ